MQYRLLKALALAVFACAIVAGPASAAPSVGARRPAPRSTPACRPSPTGAQCTANFVFYDASNVYLGQAAHCSGTGSATATDGCTSGSLPIGTPVDIGGSKPGTMVYNSWLTMQSKGEADADTCAYNDLALVKVDPADVGSVNPSIPFWGGPTGRRQRRHRRRRHGPQLRQLRAARRHHPAQPEAGQERRRRRQRLEPHRLHRDARHPRRLGLGVPRRDGKALGVLSTVAIAPLAGSNGVGDVAKELAYANSTGGFGVTLANGTEAFTGPLLPI